MKKKFVPKIFNNFVIALVPKDTNVEMTENGYFFLSKENSWSFDNLSKFIRKIPKVSQDSSCKPEWSSSDYKNFFSFVFDGGEKIVFEIDTNVSNETTETPKILIRFSKPLPSVMNLDKLIEILSLFRELTDFKFKIFSFAHYKFITLKDLKEFKENLNLNEVTNMKRKLQKIKKLNDKFISKKINANKYEKDFSKLYYDETLEEADSDFELIDNLFYLIDSYEPNKKLREEFLDYIDEKQLRERVKEFQKKIDRLLKNE